MLSLPPEPNPGEPIKASLIRSLIQAIRSLRPIPGPGVRLSTGPNGTTFSVETARKSVTEAVQDTKPWTFVRNVDPGTEEVTGGWNNQVIQLGMKVYRYKTYDVGVLDETDHGDGDYYLVADLSKDDITAFEIRKSNANLSPDQIAFWIGKVQEGEQTDGIYVMPVIYKRL